MDANYRMVIDLLKESLATTRVDDRKSLNVLVELEKALVKARINQMPTGPLEALKADVEQLRQML